MFNVYDLSWDDIVKAYEMGTTVYNSQQPILFLHDIPGDSLRTCIQNALSQLAELKEAHKQALHKRYTENKEEYDAIIKEVIG